MGKNKRPASQTDPGRAQSPHPWVPSASPTPAVPHTESLSHAQHFVSQEIANQFVDLTGRV